MSPQRKRRKNANWVFDQKSKDMRKHIRREKARNKKLAFQREIEAAKAMGIISKPNTNTFQAQEPLPRYESLKRRIKGTNMFLCPHCLAMESATMIQIKTQEGLRQAYKCFNPKCGKLYRP